MTPIARALREVLGARASRPVVALVLLCFSGRGERARSDGQTRLGDAAPTAHSTEVPAAPAAAIDAGQIDSAFTSPGRVVSSHDRPPLDDRDSVARSLLGMLKQYRLETKDGGESMGARLGIKELLAALCRLEGKPSTDLRGRLDELFDMSRLDAAVDVHCVSLVVR